MVAHGDDKEGAAGETGDKKDAEDEDEDEDEDDEDDDDDDDDDVEADSMPPLSPLPLA